MQKSLISEDSFMTGELEPTNSPYAMAKLTAIEIGRSMNVQYDHKILNLMPTNLYGPNDNFSEMKVMLFQGLYIKCIYKINNDPVFKIWGTGKPLREFLYVDDLASAIEFLILNQVDIDLLNIGSGKEVTILELANLIKKVVDYKGSIEFDLEKPDGNPRKLLDSSKINDLGWSADTDLLEGLKKYL